MPTGAGKSLIFQIAAISDPGVTIVIMPTISLINDNNSFVRSKGINSIDLSGNNQDLDGVDELIVDEILALKYKIVYMCPESVTKYFDPLFIPLYQ